MKRERNIGYKLICNFNFIIIIFVSYKNNNLKIRKYFEQLIKLSKITSYLSCMNIYLYFKN